MDSIQGDVSLIVLFILWDFFFSEVCWLTRSFTIIWQNCASASYTFSSVYFTFCHYGRFCSYQKAAGNICVFERKREKKKKIIIFFISLKQIFFSCFYFILFVSWHSLVCLNVSFCSGWSRCKSVLLEIVTWRCDVASTHLFSFVLVNLSGQGGFFSQSPCPYCVRKKGTAATCWHRFMCC